MAENKKKTPSWDKSQKDIAAEAALQAKINTNLLNWRMAHEQAYLPELLGGARQMMVDEYNRPQAIGTSSRFQPTGLVNRQRYSPEDYRLDVTVDEVEREEEEIVIDDTNVRPPPGFGHPLDGDSNPIDYIPPFPYPELIAQVIPKVIEGGGDIARGLFGWVDDRLGNKPSDLVNTMKDRLGWQSPYDYTKDWEDLVYGDEQDDGSYGKTGTDWSQWASIPNLADALGDTIRRGLDGRVQVNESLWDPSVGATSSETNPLEFTPQSFKDDPFYNSFTPPGSGPDIGGRGRAPWEEEGLTLEQYMAAANRRSNSLNSGLLGLPPIIDEPDWIAKDRLQREQDELESGIAVPVAPDDIAFFLHMFPNGVDENGNHIEFINDANGNPIALRDPTGQLRRWVNSLSGKQSGVMLEGGGAGSPAPPPNIGNASASDQGISDEQVDQMRRDNGLDGGGNVSTIPPNPARGIERSDSETMPWLEEGSGKVVASQDQVSPLSLEETMKTTMGAGPTDQIDAIIEAYKRQAGRYPSEEEVIAIIEKQSGRGSQERIM